jgi:hypothetical protein
MRGTKALHIAPMLSGTSFIRETRTFPALGKSFYGRVFVWVEQQPVEKPATLYHWTTIEAGDTATDNARKLRLGGHIEASLTNWLRFNYETSVQAPVHETGLSDTAAVLAPRTWHCLEFFFDMPTQEARFWLNGTERTRLHWLNSMPSMPLFQFPAEVKSLSFGWAEYQAALTPWEIWIDEIAVDGQRVGCAE